MRLLIICVFVFSVPSLSAQTGKWWVEFSDKSRSPYSVWEPEVFLSPRSLERRVRNGIAIVEEDLPVNPGYLEAVAATGVRVHNVSKWLNGVSVMAEPDQLPALRALPFVRRVEYLGKDIRIRNPPNQPAGRRGEALRPAAMEAEGIAPGYASRQNALLGMYLPYLAGARGEGIWVAVLDGGFRNADVSPFFDRAAASNRLFQGRDFVEGDTAVFESAEHGTSVLSVMAGNLPGYFVGTAPEATYFLLKTEDTGGEFPVEEINWVAGAEWADSLGADILNASLGYTVYDDTTLSHRFARLDGRSSYASRGARIAASKGMLVFNSAGNSGNDAWKHVGVPADADGVIAVGAIDFDGERAVFSSVGPTADGRIKPDLVAPGNLVITASGPGYDLGFSSGTSLASPLLAGAVASLWSVEPGLPAETMKSLLFASADQAGRPDNQYGYGLPDLTAVWLQLRGYFWKNFPHIAGTQAFFSHDPATGATGILFLRPASNDYSGYRYRLTDFLGRELTGMEAEAPSGGVEEFAFDLPVSGRSSWYWLDITGPGETRRVRVLTLP